MADAMDTLPDLYHAKVAAGEISGDSAQVQVAHLLEGVRVALEAPAPRGFFARKPAPVRGMYLWGDVGRGKSMLMDLFVAACDVKKRRVHFHAFMQEVQLALHEARKSHVEDALKPVGEALADVRLLALDEMQVSDIADAMILGRLFKILFDQGVTVVTTSNRPPDDLYKNGLNRPLFLPFIALIKEKMAVHHLTASQDYRQGRLMGEARWFTPPDRAAMDRLWLSLTGVSQPEALVLTVKSRKVELPAFANGVARASFWQMCGQPLGPADYLAMAEVTKAMMIDDIPALSAENFNAAKRFVTLIDALYEARVPLIASAQALPEGLYAEGEGAFEFNRTASRLREMISDQWATGDKPV
jgi:cell division protein ZapE